MDNLLRKLPIGIQTFEKLRRGDYLYVDKTDFVWKIASHEYTLFPEPSPSLRQEPVAFHFRGLFRREKRAVRGTRYCRDGNGVEAVSGVASGLERGKMTIQPVH